MMRTVASVALLAALLSAGAASAADLDSATATRSREVSLKGVDFNDRAQVENLYRRLKVTARNVCSDARPSTVAMQNRDRQCARDALDNAVAKLDRPQLRLVHTGQPAAIQVASRSQ